MDTRSSFGIPKYDDKTYGGKVPSGTELPVNLLHSNFEVEGSGTIARLTSLPKGVILTLLFLGAATLTHSSSLVCPGSNSITAAAGGSATVRSNGDGSWRVLSYDTPDGSHSGPFSITGNFSVNTDKFTVEASSGNTVVAGTLSATGNFAINTDKFTVAASSGNTVVAGTLSATGNFAVNTDKFTVAASSGNTVVAGTLGVTGASTLTGNLNAQSLTNYFGPGGTTNGNNARLFLLGSSGTGGGGHIVIQKNATVHWLIGSLSSITAAGSSDNFSIYSNSSGSVLTADLSTLAITLGGALTAPTAVITTTSADSQVSVGSVAPRIGLMDAATWASRTYGARWAMATTAAQFGLPNAGDTWFFTEGNGGAGGNLYISANAGSPSISNGLVFKTDGTVTGATAAAATNTTQLATTAFVVTEIANKALRYDAAQTLTAAQQAQARTNASCALKGQISGLTLSNNGSDATNDIDIAVGEAASTETNPVLMVLASSLTKRLDAAWTVGTNQGGLDTGSIADHDGTSTTSLSIGTGSKAFTTQSGKAFLAGEWVYAFSAGSPSNAMWGIVASYSGTTLTLTVYQVAGSGTFTDWTLQQETTIHCFLIQRSDTGVVDHLFSLSPSAPTMPTNYDRKRLHMSFIRTQGTIKAFTQYGDMIKYALARFVWNSTAVQSNFLLRQAVPSGTNIVPLIDANLQVNAAGTAILLIDDGDRSAANYAVARAGLASEWSIIHSVNFITNTAGQLRFETVIGGTVNQIQLKNLGYIHSRGR